MGILQEGHNEAKLNQQRRFLTPESLWGFQHGRKSAQVQHIKVAPAPRPQAHFAKLKISKMQKVAPRLHEKPNNKKVPQDVTTSWWCQSTF